MVVFFRNKSEVFEIFQGFKCLAENQTGIKMKMLKIDNGGEFYSKGFD